MPPPPALPPVRGIGVDVCHVPRLARAHARFGDRFLRRAFHPAEAARFTALMARGPPAAAHAFLASRWAAKEALHKALGALRLLFPDVEVVRGGAAHDGGSDGDGGDGDPPRVPLAAVPGHLGAALAAAGGVPRREAPGAPRIRFHGAAAALVAGRGLSAPPLLSLSHDGEYAVAFVLLQ